MLVAKKENQRVEACDAVAGLDYLCPDAVCGGQLRLRKRNGYVPHFFHLGEASCANEGESREHETAKIELQKNYRKRKIEAELEVFWSDVAKLSGIQATEATLQKIRAKNRRCDILLKKSTIESKTSYFAIEVQSANLASSEFNDRIHDWNLIGVPIIWVALLKQAWLKNVSKSGGSFTIEKTTLRDFEKQMHRRYGHIWYFDPDSRNFHKGTFKPYLCYKNPSDYLDAGEMVQGGGFYYPSDRWIDLALEEPIPVSKIGLKQISKKEKNGAMSNIFDWCKLQDIEGDANEENGAPPISQ